MYRYILFFIFITKIASAEDVGALFQKGMEHYQKGEYEETIKIYESITAKGFQGASLFYNLGNAYFRTGKIGYAVLYYEKAKKLSPSDEDINYNLAFANSKIVDKIETLPRFFIFEWWESILTSLSIAGWTYVTYIFYLLILISIGSYYFARSLKLQRIGFYGGLISTILLLFTAVLLIVNLNREFNVKYAVIIEQEVVTKFSPDQNSKDAFVVHEGLKVRAEDTLTSWVKVKLIDGKVGWVRKTALKDI